MADVGSLTSSHILARTGRPHWIPVTGLSLSSAALFALALVPADKALIGGLAFVTGVGFGCVMPTTQVTLQTVAGRERLGVVTALMALARSTGGAAGAALFGAVAFAMMPAVTPGVSRGFSLRVSRMPPDSLLGVNCSEASANGSFRR